MIIVNSSSGEMIMATMGRYCKAYPKERFKEFSSWKENRIDLNLEKSKGPEEKEEAGLEDDSDYYLLHEDFTVTEGIFMDEKIVFSSDSSEWAAFCKEVLKFEVPVSELKSGG